MCPHSFVRAGIKRICESSRIRDDSRGPLSGVESEFATVGSQVASHSTPAVGRTRVYSMHARARAYWGMGMCARVHVQALNVDIHTQMYIP
jgi:hypothetical protein